MARKPTVAILYDFDKTLCSDDMQNFSFIPAIGMTPEEFWGATGKFSNKTGVERILSYMFMMVQKAKEGVIREKGEFLNEGLYYSQFYKNLNYVLMHLIYQASFQPELQQGFHRSKSYEASAFPARRLRLCIFPKG